MRCMNEVQGQESSPEKAEGVRKEDMFEARVRQRRRTLVKLAVDVISSSRIRSHITMRREKSALLANRKVSICIDGNMLRGCLTLSLAPVRMSPSVELLKSIVEEFATEEVPPVVRAYTTRTTGIRNVTRALATVVTWPCENPYESRHVVHMNTRYVQIY
jgi:hypothetical protein